MYKQILTQTKSKAIKPNGGRYRFNFVTSVSNASTYNIFLIFK